jgi:FtsP/CotA-like multicopper oxidase with cupredoxin domain
MQTTANNPALTGAAGDGSPSPARQGGVSCVLPAYEARAHNGQVEQDHSRQTRRNFFHSAAGAGLLLSGCGSRPGPAEEITGPADVTLRIGRVLADIAKDHTISTVGYNGSVPGPLIRLKEGKAVIVDLFNDTDTPELVHWHGLLIPADVDGAEEEKSLAVAPHGHLRYRLVPRPAGARWVHSHVMSMGDLNRGTYSGQFGFVYVEPSSNPGNYDQEIFLASKEWEPFFTTMEEEEEDEPTPQPPPGTKKDDKPNGWEIGYQRFTINGKALGYGEPVRVKQGQRVLFHILNGSATENIKLALPGHRFQIVGLDGNAVPRPAMVDVLELGTAERIDAVVEMKNPGVWILGTPKDDDRKDGLGIVVEYAGKTGSPRWVKPPKARWDYTLFDEDRATPAPHETIPMVFGKINGGTGQFNHWTINGKEYDEKAAPRTLEKGKRYRLVFDNQTDDAHPVHLHRNLFELTSVSGKRTAGVMKDVVLVKGFQKIEVDFTPELSGLTLFHCHQQLHMDFGFKTVFNVT